MEYLVITPKGQDYGRDKSLADCRDAARRLGKGAKVEELDDMLCHHRPRKIVFEVK